MSSPSSAHAAIVVHSCHHGNTAKVARAIGEILETSVVEPSGTPLEIVRSGKLIGLGSSIYGAKQFAGELLHRLGADTKETT